jgi:hypothetical protein
LGVLGEYAVILWHLNCAGHLWMAAIFHGAFPHRQSETCRSAWSVNKVHEGRTDIDTRYCLQIEFKAVIVHGNGGVQWENGPNRVIQLPEEGGSYAVKLHWENTAEELRLEGTEGQTVETEAPEEKESGSEENGGQNSESGISFPASKWQPRDIEVIEHTR